MKGCFYLPFKLFIFVVLYFVFINAIWIYIGAERPEFYFKSQKNLTKEEVREIVKYQDQDMFGLGNSIFLGLPPTILTTYLIFRKKRRKKT